tara:strand:+ start:2201 stop:4630 length:2430 start_codon:yes stop_codon:yes gene_type:complete
MAIDKPAGFEQAQEKAIEQLVEIEANEFVDGATPNVEIMEDGSAIVGEQLENLETTFDMNLAEILQKDVLADISSELRQAFEDDKASRKDWEDTYKKGLDLLGFKYQERTMPFAGASSVTHPMLSEAITQFQAQAYKELLPAGGPVNTQILGNVTSQKEEQSQRVKDYMNYQITYEMEEYDPDMDSLLFYLPLSGSAFKKVYYDEGLERAVSKFIPSDDLYVPYQTTDFPSCERVTHTLRRSQNEVRKLQVAGMYRDVDLSVYDNETGLQEKESSISGVRKSYRDEDYQLLEMHVDLNIEGVDNDDGIKVPYLVTIDEGSGNILSIYRNYDENDSKQKKKQYFVHYKFLPGFSFYGFGLIHMLGGLSRTATSALRQLLDAGTLSNLPAGFKARGLRVKDDDTPLQPGEFRDVDAPGGSLRDGLLPLPYKEPSQTLFALLSFCVEAGSRFASIADQKIGDAAQAGAPVGTTMALMERGARVMSAIHKRLHYAQKIEFKLLAKIFAESLPPVYPYEVGKEAIQSLKAEDFSNDIDIIPISDPNIFSMSQRVTLAQTQLQLAQADPQSHNMYEAYRRMYQALGVKDIDVILPVPPTPQPQDPGVENSASLKGSNLVAFRQQNQGAHIDAHRSFMSSVLVKSNPQVLMILSGHIMDHVSIQAREEVEADNQGEIEQVTAQYGGKLPEELQLRFQEQIEQQVAEKISIMTAEMVGEEQEMMQSMQEDPLIDLKQQEIDIKSQDLQRKAAMDQGRLGIDQEKLDQTARIAQDRIDSQEDIAQLRANVNLTKQKEIEKSKRDVRKVDVNKNIRFDN